MMVATHSARFIRRRAIGEAHRVPASQARRSSRFSTTKPNPSEITVPITKYGRSGPNVAASPAPLRPSATATSGPAQQSADPIAAATLAPAANTVLLTGEATVSSFRRAQTSHRFLCFQASAIAMDALGTRALGPTLNAA